MKFVGEVIYIHTWQCFFYLAAVTDCYPKKVRGRSIVDNHRTGRPRPEECDGTPVIEADAMLHSDWGSVYLAPQLAWRSTLGYRRPSDVQGAHPRQVFCSRRNQPGLGPKKPAAT